MKIEERLEALGLTLPPPPRLPQGVLLPFEFVRIVGSSAFISGHGPQAPDGSFAQPLGKLGRYVSVEQGYTAARLTAWQSFRSTFLSRSKERSRLGTELHCSHARESKPFPRVSSAHRTLRIFLLLPSLRLRTGRPRRAPLRPDRPRNADPPRLGHSDPLRAHVAREAHTALLGRDALLQHLRGLRLGRSRSVGHCRHPARLRNLSCCAPYPPRSPA